MAFYSIIKLVERFMKYPNNIKKNYHKEINYKNRGMNLETIINEASAYYRDNDLAIIYKKSTPIGVVDVDYKQGIIKKAYYKEPSTLDYNGIYKGKYIEFDAKECYSKTSFPLKNISDHQLKHLEKIIKHGGICFLVIAINDKYYLLKGEDLLSFINNNDRKSIPLAYIVENGWNINYNYNIGLDYLKGIEQAYEGAINDEKN